MIVRFRKASLLADFIVLVSLCLAPVSVFADASIDGREVLARQSIAMAQASYSGLLTYEHGTHLSTIEINHQVIQGVEHESLIHLSGDAREIRRNTDHNHCPFPGEQLMRGSVPQGVQVTQDIDDFYHISILGFERIAGRQSIVVQVMPRDQHRYGYIVSVDKDSYLALKTLLIGPGAKVIERFQFSKIVIDAAPSLATQNSAGEDGVEGCDLVAAESTALQWIAQWLPPGFVFAGEKRLSEQRLMLKYTDGLSAFSIFIDRLDAPSIVEGRAQRGATVAYLGRLESSRGNYRVTAVGEVPAPTLERVAMSLREKI
ncbi:MucB/RseB C-terminal domain-containing protein [Simiduia curdlanivorans]|uniref:MucB/RseB C-terminal domain-containing protein n=1 Tax=Simiduia curdlanivorans TaxID=1492769 RepID=A0ABV8V7J2_9GAMM|nr:MucB/RseB C-terminal domain-containing protein [Simiduia curdlanivorans]MDN3639797.1 MucB/RseB C-terminal domain-containing protein [Simiduia curdlanivorans]